MKIEYGSRTAKVRYDALVAGDVFRRHDEDLYIKTDQEDDEDDTYAVQLDNGYTIAFPDNGMVIPVSAKVVVLDGTGDCDD